MALLDVMGGSRIPVISQVTARRAGKPGSGVTWASRLQLSRSYFSYVFVVHPPLGRLPRLYIALYLI